jgi:hypothetical protein
MARRSRVTPAMAAGVTDYVWNLDELLKVPQRIAA